MLTTVSCAQAVRVKFMIEIKGIDPKFSADETSFSFKRWTHYSPVNPADGNLQIVQANQGLLAIFAALGGEASVRAIHGGAALQGVAATCGGLAALLPAASLPYCYLAPAAYQALLDEKALGLNSDGTGKNNAGLFVRLTINQLNNGGYVDPLTQMPSAGPAFGKNAFPTPEALEAAIAVGLEPFPARYELSMKTSKEGVEQSGELISYATYDNITDTRNDIVWGVSATGYDNTGSTAPNRGPFVISGYRADPLPAPPLTEVPLVWETGVPPKISRPESSLAILDEVFLWREVNYSCAGNECEIEHVDRVRLMKYRFDESNGWLKVGGVRDLTGACVATLSCDFGSVFPNVWHKPGFPLAAFSLAYFGNSSAMLTAAVTIVDAQGASLTYDDSTMRPTISIEPLSGVALSKNIVMQTNLQGISAMVFDANPSTGLFANVFTGVIPPPLWPYSVHLFGGFSNNEATKGMADEYNFAYAVMLGANITGVLAVLLCCCLARRAHKLSKRARVSTNPKGGKPTTPLDA